MLRLVADIATIVVPIYSGYYLTKIGIITMREGEMPRLALLLAVMPSLSALWVLYLWRVLHINYLAAGHQIASITGLAISVVALYFLSLVLLWQLSRIYWIKKSAYQGMALSTCAIALILIQIWYFWPQV